MLFLYILSIISLVVQATFVTISIAAGLYYLAELVEEYTVTAKYVITWLVIVSTLYTVLIVLELIDAHCKLDKGLLEWPITAAIHVGLLLLEDLPQHLNALGLLQQGLHALLLRQFPVVRPGSAVFCAAVGNLALSHYCAFRYFGYVYHNFSEVLAYFTLCLWVVPFALFVSLSANDYVLPTTATATGDRLHLLDDDNVVSDYLSRKAKKYSLLSLFSYAKESILPQRCKKAF